MKPKYATVTSEIRECIPLCVTMGNSTTTSINKSVECEIKIANMRYKHEFYILDECLTDCILGFDFQQKHKCHVIPEKQLLMLQNGDQVPLLSKFAKTFLPTAAITATPETHFSKEVRDNEHKNIEKAEVGKNLTTEEKEKILEILAARVHQFTTKDKPLGLVKSTYHRIQPAGQPFMMKVKALSPGFRAVQKDAIKKMLDYGVLVPTVSAWGTTTTFASKKTQEIRPCMNFCRLNRMDTIKDNYPLPRAPQLLEKFTGKKFFTTLDCAAGYWNIPIHPDDRKYTAVICEEGHFEHARMPFGLRNAPATFQRLMDKILKPHTAFTQAYLDDVIIFSNSLNDHLQHVQIVMDAVHEEGFLFRLAKCSFAMPEVEYLGHYVGRDGIRMNSKKLMEIKNFPVPKTVKQVQSFVGLTGYYRKFIRDYGKISSPLTELTKKNVPWAWTLVEQEAFDKLLKAFETNVVLHHPDYNKQFYIDTDASDLGISAVLTQYDNENNERPVFFASRKLTTGERKWHIREKEALAIIYGCRTFRHHVLGTQFVVRTDHESLKWIMDAKTGRISRWGLLLSEYEPFEVRYRKGELNKVADAFSRLYEPSECLPDNVFFGEIQLTIHNTVSASYFSDCIPSREAIKFQQAFDSFCVKKKEKFQKAESQHMREKEKPTAETSLLPFSYREGLLGIATEGYFKPLLPRHMAADVLKRIHSHPMCAHLGVKRTCARLTDSVIAPGLRKIARKVLSQCLPCQRRKAAKPKHGFLRSKPPTHMHQQVAMDFCGPYKTSNEGYQYVLVIIDQFTKWVELIPCKSATAATVLDAFYTNVVCRFGVPEQLLTDNGSHFRNYLVETTCQIFGCFKAYSAPYYPEGDGQAERFMRNLNDSLAILCDQNVEEWHAFVPGVQYAYNTTPHSVTSITPYEMVFGKKPQPLSTEPQLTNILQTRISQHKYVLQLKNVIRNVQDRARQNIISQWVEMATRYNRNRRAVTIKTGSYVLVKLTASYLDAAQETGRKLAMKWSPPAQVVGTKTNGKTFDVQHQDGRVQVVNATQLLPLPQSCWAPKKFTFRQILRDVDAAVQRQNEPATSPDVNNQTWVLRVPPIVRSSRK